MFNVGFGELAVIVLVCLVVFGPERLPEVARQIGRFIGQARLYTQRMLDELRTESELKDLNLPDLKVGNLRRQARNYVTGLMDVEGQMAELEGDTKERPKPTRAGASAKAAESNGAAGSNGTAGTGTTGPEAAEPGADTSGADMPGADATGTGAGTAATGTAAAAGTAGDASTSPPVDPDAT